MRVDDLGRRRGREQVQRAGLTSRRPPSTGVVVIYGVWTWPARPRKKPGGKPGPGWVRRENQRNGALRAEGRTPPPLRAPWIGVGPGPPAAGSGVLGPGSSGGANPGREKEGAEGRRAKREGGGGPGLFDWRMQV